MPGNPLVRFDEGRVGRTTRCRPLSYSTVSVMKPKSQPVPSGPGRRQRCQLTRLQRAVVVGPALPPAPGTYPDDARFPRTMRNSGYAGRGPARSHLPSPACARQFQAARARAGR